uniref:Uncharacterized protein n=1 Tax=Romanomermis culicivorax TaxID=13658 RepID=A0A915KE20_ROMCU
MQYQSTHNHDMQCDGCERVKSVLKHVQTKLSSINFASEQELTEIYVKIGKVVKCQLSPYQLCALPVTSQFFRSPKNRGYLPVGHPVNHAGDCIDHPYENLQRDGFHHNRGFKYHDKEMQSRKTLGSHFMA